MNDVGRARLVAPGGCEIRRHMLDAWVIVTGEADRLDVTVLPERTVVAFAGDHGPEPFAAILLIDYLREQGDLTGDPAALSVLQLANLAELRDARAPAAD